MNRKVLKWNFIFQYGYVLTNIFNSLLLLPLYLKNIDPATLGIWLATGNILSWMTLIDPGVGDVLQQKIAELRGKNLNEEAGKTIGSGFIASAGMLLLSVLAGYLFYLSAGYLIDKDISLYPNLRMALILSVLATGISLVSFSFSGINQGLLNAAQVAIASLLSNFVFLLVNIVFMYTGYGVISIAIAGLCRALFLALYNLSTMLALLRKENLTVIYQFDHFKKFIRIFSITSVSKIISGLATSIDLIILARFIPPAMITIYEVNKRPIKLTQSLIGRHSVALMPSISHERGKDNKPAIMKLINTQFRFYSYAALFVSFIFCIIYYDIIALWTGKGQYAGDTIVYLLVANFFFGLIGYFMANIGYALGDIKKNSIIYIVRGLVLSVLLILVAEKYLIAGTLVASLVVVITIELFYFSHRLYKLGYLDTALLRNIASKWLIILPLAGLSAYACKTLIGGLFPSDMYFNRILLNGSIFTLLFISLVWIFDSHIRLLLSNSFIYLSRWYTNRSRK